MSATIRFAGEADAPAVASIYGPFCSDTAVSFELTAPTVSEMADRMRRTTERFPWLVLAEDRQVIGYAFASAHRERPAYQWSVDVSAYVAAGCRRRGIGRALYTALFEILRSQGFYKAFAGIALPNLASIGLHTAMGFEAVGVYRGAGYKLGAWHDVGWYQLTLQPQLIEPEPPRTAPEIADTSLWKRAILSGMAYYHGPA